MRPTRAGFGLIAVTVGAVIAGRVLGLLEMFILAAICGAALAFAAVYTATARLDLGVHRSATPARLRAGAPARIDLTLRNQGRRRTPLMHAHDSVQGSRGASLMLAAISSGDHAHIAYRLPTQRRGVLKVGPLDLTLGDPMGLTQARLRAAEVTTLMVHPRLVDLQPLTAIAGRDPTADQQPRRALAISGDEFFALRPYVIGDELKRVNWRASARSDDLVVRQEERPKTGRITVILDRRDEAYDVEGFERAVSAALSALHSGFRGGDALRFVTSAGSAVTDVRSRADLDAIDEQLALITATASASLVQVIDEQVKMSKGGTMVIVTGHLNDSVEKVVAQARRSFGLVVVVSCQRPNGRSVPWAIYHDGATDLPAAWRRATTPSLNTVGSAV
ncbi:MAG: DUF58 domain-containing protein [Actinomycetota bacterium]